MSRLILGRPCVNPSQMKAGPLGMNTAAYFGQTSNCPPAEVQPPLPPGYPRYFVQFDWDACLIPGDDVPVIGEKITLDGVQYVAPNWPAGDYCCTGCGSNYPWPNPGNAVDGLTIWEFRADLTYFCIFATGGYKKFGWEGRDGPLLPPQVSCTQNNDPVPTPPNCECCAGAPYDIPGIVYCSTWSYP